MVFSVFLFLYFCISFYLFSCTPFFLQFPLLLFFFLFFNRLRAYRRAKVFREVVRGVVRLYAYVVVCFCVCLFVVCSFSVFACSFLFCLVGCLCVRVLFACLYVSLLMLAKAFQNACQNGRKIVQKLIKIDEKTEKI